MEKNSLSTSTPGCWTSRGGVETIKKLQKIIEMRQNNDIELHVEVWKRGNLIKTEKKSFKYLTLILVKTR